MSFRRNVVQRERRKPSVVRYIPCQTMLTLGGGDCKRFEGEKPMIEFNRRYVLVPVILAVTFVTTAFLITEVRREQVMNTAALIQRSEERLRLLFEMQSLMSDAEAGQRGYILTGDRSYLEPYNKAKQEIGAYLDQLRRAYHDGDEASAKNANKLIELVGAKFAEVDATLAMYETSARGALAVVKTNVGQQLMDALRHLTTEMRQAERDAIAAKTNAWHRNHVVNRSIAAAGAVLNIVLILLAGHLVSNAIRRRTSIAMELETQVERRTQELSALSSHLQRVVEVEKSALASELHDELGGLLVAIKMDLAQVQKQLDFGQPELRARWERIQAALSAGVDLKRRVVEQLRPTLLDNMGLVAALRWQFAETCKQANLLLVEQFPEEESDVSNDAAIAIFRVAQEALLNIVKHAKANTVRAALRTAGERFEPHDLVPAGVENFDLRTARAVTVAARAFQACAAISCITSGRRSNSQDLSRKYCAPSVWACVRYCGRA